MRFNEFIDALYAAGWRCPLDAQHTEIRKLYEKLFPTVAVLENLLYDAEHEAANQRKRDECIGRFG